MNAPETRQSLLLRIQDPANQTAWDEFSAIYRPVICRLAVRRGLQPTDAEDLAQQVLLAVSTAISRWEADPERARFRTWLRKVTDNAALNALTRGPQDRGSGDSGLHQWLEQRPGESAAESQLLRLEFRREVFQRAARQIQAEFSAGVWRAFWMTAVEGMDGETAGRQLGVSRGSVYASRSRVMKRFRQVVEQFDENQ